MGLVRRAVTDRTCRSGYTVDEVARFLQYDPQAVRYWLRTGHLLGIVDPHDGQWRVPAPELVTFLRQTSEPMPTGVIGDAFDVSAPVHAGPEPVSGATNQPAERREPALAPTIST
jgi:hypothetical protein